MEGKIICGFAGIGKSYCAKKILGVVDLESTPFNKNWELYTDVAKHMALNGYTVLVSCHKELREKLKEKDIQYTLVIPASLEKENYIERYKERGNTKEFIEMMDTKWSEFTKYLPHEDIFKMDIIVLNGFLIDILNKD